MAESVGKWLGGAASLLFAPAAGLVGAGAGFVAGAGVDKIADNAKKGAIADKAMQDSIAQTNKFYDDAKRKTAQDKVTESANRERDAAIMKERQNLFANSGRSGTILTGPKGFDGGALGTTAGKTLLGS